MSVMHLADGSPLLCERCDTVPAKYYVSGTIPNYEAICPRCAADICASKDDAAGVELFMKVAEDWERACLSVMA